MTFLQVHIQFSQSFDWEQHGVDYLSVLGTSNLGINVN